MKLSIFIICALSILGINACQPVSQSTQVETSSKVIGTWRLISNTVQKGDSITVKDLSNAKMIKILNGTHFAFLNHDLFTNDTSALAAGEIKNFVAGGGTYTLNGTTYKEHLEYCNFRGWENNDFTFELYFSGDTLIQKGIEEIEELGVSQVITEKYLPESNNTKGLVTPM